MPGRGIDTEPSARAFSLDPVPEMEARSVVVKSNLMK